jgi:replication-associated recombination protein RarA
MRPQTLAEFIGQKHVLGPDKVLRRAIETDQLVSMILWGPPGVGKTTLARLIANATRSQFFSLSAVSSGVGEVRKVIARAESCAARQINGPCFLSMKFTGSTNLNRTPCCTALKTVPCC